MKATFEFSLPEDSDDYEMYRRAPEYHNALCELREWLRAERKSGQRGLEVVWNEFHEVCEEFVNDL